MVGKRQARVEKPVEAGEEVEIEIEDLGHAGEGIGRVEGFAIFVPGALPGDRVLARVDEVKKRYGRATLQRVVRPAASRVAPECSVFEGCGGCQLQHMDYQQQLAWKRQRVADVLTRVGNFLHPTVRETLGMAHPYYYRNKAQYPVARAGREVVTGFYRRGTHKIVPLDECGIQHPLNNTALKVMRDLLQKYGIPPYDETSGKGLVRHIISRASITRQQVMVTLVTNGYDLPHVAELIDDLRLQIPQLISVAQNINTRRTNTILGEETRIVWGEKYLIDEIGGLQFAISPRSFFQVNPIQTGVLYEVALRYANLTGWERVLDCYCGIGTITLHLARNCQSVVGIEVVQEAVADAYRNARMNGLSNVKFIVGAVEKELPAVLAEGRIDVAILDPPRKGCEAGVLTALAAAGIPRLVYVSCNPGSLARDLRLLADQGYELEEVQPVDMFPHTFHVECVAKLEKER